MTGKKLCAKPLSGVLLACDLDGTLVDGDTLFRFFDEFGLKEEAVRLDAVEPSSDVRLLLNRIAGKQAIGETTFQRIADEARLFEGADDFFARMQSLGARVCLLSATYEPIALRIAQRLRLKDAMICATRVKIQDGKVTGFLGPLMDRVEKRRALERVCKDLGVAFSNVVGIADAPGDKEFMERIQEGGGQAFWVKKPDFAVIEESILARFRGRGVCQ